MAIPPGSTLSYGEVARLAGLPGRARLVARWLANQPDPALPWHRIVRSDGRIAFAEGSAEFFEQSARLSAEGVRTLHGRIRKRPPVDALDRVLWGGDKAEAAG